MRMHIKIIRVFYYLKNPPLTLQATFLATHKTGIVLFAYNIKSCNKCMLPKIFRKLMHILLIYAVIKIPIKTEANF